MLTSQNLTETNHPRRRNLYYHAVMSRKNALKEFLYDIFLGLASWPRMLLEVFIRKNMGERYFSFSTAVLAVLVLSTVPYIVEHFKSAVHDVSSIMSPGNNPFGSSGNNPFGSSGSPYGPSANTGNSNSSGQGNGFFVILGINITWYIFLAAFLFFCTKRRKEIERLPSVFDFARFSLSTGQVHPKFYTIKLAGKYPDIRIIQTIIEPAFFLVIGVVLMLAQQMVGYLIVICSILYSGSYFAAYHVGDNFVMDKIDEIICNEELVASFVDDRDPGETRGFSAYGRKPVDPDLRRKVVDTFFEDDEDTVEAN